MSDEAWEDERDRLCEMAYSMAHEARLSALREVREMVATKPVSYGKQYALVVEIVRDIDALIAKEGAK